nr:MAG TPA: hypothetical protein [Caudoviricetes sp.]
MFIFLNKLIIYKIYFLVNSFVHFFENFLLTFLNYCYILYLEGFLLCLIEENLRKY